MVDGDIDRATKAKLDASGSAPAAGEAPTEGVNSDVLVAGMNERGHRSAQTVAGADALADALAGVIAPGDMVVCLGAGDITKWAAGLADAIAKRLGV